MVATERRSRQHAAAVVDTWDTICQYMDHLVRTPSDVRMIVVGTRTVAICYGTTSKRSSLRVATFTRRAWRKSARKLIVPGKLCHLACYQVPVYGCAMYLVHAWCMVYRYLVCPADRLLIVMSINRFLHLRTEWFCSKYFLHMIFSGDVNTISINLSPLCWDHTSFSRPSGSSILQVATSSAKQQPLNLPFLLVPSVIGLHARRVCRCTYISRSSVAVSEICGVTGLT